jgi:hypothetical protein
MIAPGDSEKMQFGSSAANLVDRLETVSNVGGPQWNQTTKRNAPIPHLL